MLFEEIRSQLRPLRDSGEAIARVDLVTHSMGGVIARTMAKSLQYNNTFGKGLIRCIVTMGTQHWGSPWANLLLGRVDIQFDILA